MAADSGNRLEEMLAEHARRVANGETIIIDELAGDDPVLIQQLQAAVLQQNETADLRFAPTIIAPKPTIILPKSIAAYEIQREIARGGMGVVYKAYDKKLGRPVALKAMLAGAFASTDAQQRFQIEARAAANLEHSGIVPIYEIGEFEGQPFFTMALIDGASLQERLKAGPLAPPEAARITLALARAVHYAHEKGVVHRDLKPGNVLIDTTGTPKVTDFGLAKRTDDDANLTATEAVLGTPSYMAPEQASGHSREASASVDIYALGAVLYACLTGNPPFAAASFGETIRQVIEQPPIAPRSLNQLIPRDLETICLKCLEKEPSRRYSTAAELAAELERFEQGQPILARPVTVVEKIWRWCNRNPVVAVLTTVALLLLASVGIVTTSSYVRESRLQSQKEMLAKDKAKLATLNLELEAESSTLASSLKASERLTQLNETLSNGFSEYLNSRDESAYDHLFKAWQYIPENENDLKTSLLRTICDWKARGSRTQYLPVRHATQVSATAFSPDGNYIATGSYDGASQIWDARTGESIAVSLRHRGIVNVVAFGPRGDCVLTASDDGTARIWDAKKGTPIGKELNHGGRVLVAIFSPSGDQLVTAGSKNYVRLWNTYTGEPIGDIMEHSGALSAVAFSPNGEQVLTGSYDNYSRLWNASTGKLIGKPLLHDKAVIAVAISPQGNKFLTASHHTARLWDLDTLSPIGEPMEHESAVVAVSFSPQGDRMLTASSSQFKIWHSPHVGNESEVFNSPIEQAAFSPDGARVVTRSGDRIVQFWNAETLMLNVSPITAESRILSMAFSPQGDRLLLGLENNTARIYSVNSEALWKAYTVKQDSDSFSPTADTLLTVSDESTAQIVNVETDEPVGNSLRHETPIILASYSAKWDRIATYSEDETLRIWEVKTGHLLGEPIKNVGDLSSIAFGPLVNILITANSNGAIQIWNTSTNQMIGTAMQPNFATDAEDAIILNSPKTRILIADRKESLAQLWNASNGSLVRKLAPNTTTDTVSRNGVVGFNPAGDYVLTHHSVMTFSTGRSEGVTQLWSAITGEEVGKAMKGEESLISYAFDAQGDRLVTGTDKTAYLWNTRTGERIGTPMEHATGIMKVAFSPQGDRICTGSADGTVKLWNSFDCKQLFEPMKHSAPILKLSFTLQGDRVITLSNGEVRMWDAITGAPIGEPLRDIELGQIGKIRSFCFINNGKYLLTNAGGRLKLWNIERPPVLKNIKLAMEVFTGKTFGNNGQLEDLIHEKWSDKRTLLSRENSEWLKVQKLAAQNARESFHRKSLKEARETDDKYAIEFHEAWLQNKSTGATIKHTLRPDAVENPLPASTPSPTITLPPTPVQPPTVSDDDPFPLHESTEALETEIKVRYKGN